MLMNIMKNVKNATHASDLYFNDIVLKSLEQWRNADNFNLESLRNSNIFTLKSLPPSSSSNDLRLGR